MGRGNKPKVEPAKDYTAALATANTRTPEQEALSRMSLKTLNWAEKGDYRDPREGGVFVNYADPAMLREHRALEENAGGQGIYALGSPDPNYLATVKQRHAAENERADAAQYEGDIKEGVMTAAGIAGNEAALEQSRRMGVLGVTSGVYQQHAARPKWWQSLLQAGGQVGAGLASNPELLAAM